MTLWRRFGFAGFESAIYRGKRWYSFTHTSRAPSSCDFVRLRGFRVSEQPFPASSPLFCCTHFRYFFASGQAKPKPKVEGKGGDWRKPNVEDDVGIRINEAINEREVRLVTDQGHRVVSIQEALYLARKLDLDLVEVQRKVKVEGGAQYPVYKPAVCKFMDYCKEKYKQDVKEKERAKGKAANTLRNGENKEVRFKAKTEPKDLKIKAESVKRLMERGYRVKCTAMSTGKEDDDLGGLLLNLLALIEDISAIESGPHLDTKNAYVIVKHIKYGSKKGKKISKALETLNSVLSSRSNSAVDSNSTSKDENSSQSEEEWEAVESDSEIKIDDQSKQVRTNAQSLSNPHPALPQKGFGSVPDWSGFKAADEIKADITSNSKHTSSSRIISASEESVNKSSGRNTAGFHPPQPEPYVTEPNRYSKSSNSTFHQTNPMNRGPSFPWKAGIENRQRIPEQRNRREIDGHIRSNPNDRPAHNYNPNSSPARHGAFGASQSPVSNDRSKAGGATMPNPNEPKAPQQSYGIFSSTKSSSSADERHMRDIISKDRVSKSNSPSSNYGIFSTPKPISSDDQMKLRNSTRDNSTRFDPGYNDSSISNNESSPSPRFGIFTSSKKASSSDGRNVDKS